MTIVEWLSQRGLQEYVPQFEANHITVDSLPSLTDADLKEIGVTSLGHRKTILSAMAEDDAEKEKGIEIELKDGVWVHPEGGYAYIAEKGDNPVFVTLSVP